jgi:4-diphosphocytidyl-2-C-methyl-D-erythritol kinase
MTSLTLRAPAKLNLNLRVVGRRPDGYHDIESVVQSVTLHDTLEIIIAGEGLALEVRALEVDDRAIPAGPENLVCRAAERLLGGLRDRPGLRMRLTKRIPAGAGLGGGSSDAAAALVGIDRLLGLGLPPAALAAHAAALGSDIPYFLVGGTALLTGRGTEVEPLPDAPPAELLIVHPGAPLSTAAVYVQLQEPLTLAPKPVSIPGFGRIPVDLVSWVRAGNDLEPHAARLCPDIVRIKTMLAGAGAVAAAVTGSGSAVFGLFENGAAAAGAARRAEQDGFRALRCRTLDRATYLSERMLP